jgi:HD-GYP domain-containing protein (c-di-GMP phosphodiesterase class II)
MDTAEFQSRVAKVVTQFTAAVQNAGIYPEEHPQVLSYIHETHHLLEELFGAQKEVTIFLIGDGLMADKRPLGMAGASEAAFVKLMRDHALERVTFLRGLPLTQLKSFIGHLSTESLSAMPTTSHIQFGKLETKDPNEQDTDDTPEAEIDEVHDLQVRSAEERIRNIYHNTLSGERIDPEDTEEIVRHFMDSLQREAKPLSLLAETKSNDEYTFTHTANVGILTLFFAEQLGFEGSHLNNIGVAAILHDVGKITTPDEILSKPGALTPEERAVMETHSLKGALHLMEQANITVVAVLAALEHHMKYDGSGYPRVKGGWEQNIVSQMISIADVYDALRTTRPYRPQPMPMDRIIQIFEKGSGTDFNPYLVKRFLSLVGQ